METITLDGLRRDPAGFIDRITAGDVVVLQSDGRAVAEVRPIPSPRTAPRPYGLAAGESTVPDDFDDPLPTEFQQFFE